MGASTHASLDGRDSDNGGGDGDEDGREDPGEADVVHARVFFGCEKGGFGVRVGGARGVVGKLGFGVLECEFLGVYMWRVARWFDVLDGGGGDDRRGACASGCVVAGGFEGGG